MVKRLQRNGVINRTLKPLHWTSEQEVAMSPSTQVATDVMFQPVHVVLSPTQSSAIERSGDAYEAVGAD